MAELRNPEPKESIIEALRREEEEFNEKHPILDTRYYVQEWRKAYTPWFDPYDDEVRAKLLHTYGPFNEAEYHAFLAMYKPGGGEGYDQREFKTLVEHLRHYSYDKWGR